MVYPLDMSEGDASRLELKFRRALTEGGQTLDRQQQWAWCRRTLGAGVLLGGEGSGELIFFRTEDVLSTPTHNMVELGSEALIVAAQRRIMAGQAVGRFRVGELTVPSPDGPRRAAVILQIDDEGEGWQVEWRHFGRTPEGVGRWRGEWASAQASTIDEAPEWLLEWVDDRKAEITGQEVRDGGDGPGIDVRAAVLPAVTPVPDDPRAVAQLLHQSLDQELLTQGLTAILLFVLRADCTERWELRRVAPFSLDDMVRAVCANGDAPVAVALVHHVNVEFPDGRCLPGFCTVVQRGDLLARRIMPLELRDQRVVAHDPQFPPVEPIVDRWIGTPPSVPIQLTPLGPDDTDPVEA